MNFIPVKRLLIVIIALLVALLSVFRSAVSLLHGVSMFSERYIPVTLADIVVRGFFTFLFSWAILEFNANWRYKYSNLSIVLKSFITVIVNLAMTTIILKVLFLVYPILVDVELSEPDRTRFYFGYFVIFLILFFIAGVLRYQKVNQKQAIENERLKQQNLKNELVALKNQINPHFLFNSLNTLNSLIRSNKEATKFVNKLSFMYRYILQSSDRDLVTLKEELKFLESYIFLIKTRYRNRFEMQIDIDDDLIEEKVPPLALQLLVENAVKHNEISETNPLLVKVYVKDGYLYVENKIKSRATFVDSTGNGLSNLNKRCMLLNNNKIIIDNSKGIFKVSFLLKKKE